MRRGRATRRHTDPEGRTASHSPGGSTTTESPEHERPPALRAGLVAAALVALLTVVAVSAVAREPLAGRSSGGRDVSPVLWDYVLSTFVALYVALIPVALYVSWARGGWRRDPNAGRRRDVGILVFVGVLLVALLGLRGLREVDVTTPPAPTTPTAGVSTAVGEAESERRRGELKLAPFVVVGLAIGAVVAYVAYDRRRHRRPFAEGDETALAEELGLLLDDAIDDLRAEPDPRRAVIAAYARMERALAAFGLPREEAEAPLEYLDRIAREILHVPGAPGLAFELTHLYERARFSAHAVDAEMKEDAIEALVRLRAELQEWAA